MLTSYLNKTKRLLQNPSPSSALIYSDADLTSYINEGRNQLAQVAKCIRAIHTVSTVINQRAYNFSSLAIGTPAVTGIAGVLNVRRINVAIGAGGEQRVDPRPWEWFDLYAMNNPAPSQGQPAMWAQYAQGASGQQTGSSSSGSFYIDPLPDGIYQLNCDDECYPIPLVDDTTVEAIPFNWLDIVPFWGAYFALLSSQTGERAAMAEEMKRRASEFMQAARTGATPDVLAYQYEGTPDPMQISKLASGKGGG